MFGLKLGKMLVSTPGSGLKRLEPILGLDKLLAQQGLDNTAARRLVFRQLL